MRSQFYSSDLYACPWDSPAGRVTSQLLSLIVQGFDYHSFTASFEIGSVAP